MAVKSWHRGWLAALGLGCMLSLTGCREAAEINDMVFPLFVGVDKGEENHLLLTVKFPTYSGGGSGGSSSSSGEENPYNQGSSNVYTVECPTIIEGIDMMSQLMPKQVSLTHVEFFCLGEELAKEGVNQYIIPLERDGDSSSIMQLLVVKGKAKDFIVEHSSSMSSNYTREASLIMQHQDSGMKGLQFGEFYSLLFSPYGDTMALYGGVESEDQKNMPPRQRDGMENELGTGMLPGQTGVEGPQKSLVSGMAIFRGEKLAGVLDSYELGLLDLLKGSTAQTMTFTVPGQPDKKLTIRVGNETPVRRRGWIEGDRCYVRLELDLRGSLQENQSEISFESQQHIGQLDAAVQQTLQKDMEQLIHLLQTDMKADALGLGRLFIGKFPTVQEWEQFGWFRHYPQCQVELKVHYTTRRSNILYQEDERRNQEMLEKFQEERDGQ